MGDQMTNAREAGGRASFEVSERNRVKRLHDRGRYDTATIYPILDAALLAHIAYVIDGQPYCTPTAFWREEDRLYWHGSSASRMLRTQATGVPVCVTVAHIDGLVMARSGFHHSINYRSVMAFGRASVVDNAEAKLAAMNAFVDRFYPGRTRLMRAPDKQEIKATTILEMTIEQAAAKVRRGPPVDDEADYASSIWAGVIPVSTVIGPAIPCPRLGDGVQPAGDIDRYVPGRAFGEILTGAHAELYGA
jgi:nitroimidazol reductase NimA-like FMN-containing flavoprotein (pyridoxamine 5'-phosphate oxidase superfamily)